MLMVYHPQERDEGIIQVRLFHNYLLYNIEGAGGGGLAYLTYYYCKVENCASCHTEAVGLVLRVSRTNSGVSLKCCADSCVVCLL